MVEKRVAVMNTSKEITQMLQELLRIEGFSTCTLFTYELKNNEVYFDEYVKVNRPDVILYDIAIPYEENYFLFKHISSRKSAKKIPFVLTTTNKRVLDKLVGKTEAFEVIGKPYDLKEITDAIKKVIK
jgi:DNA-binding response OmpR family regulator